MSYGVREPGSEPTLRSKRSPDGNTYVMAVEDLDVDSVAADLSECRQRGLEWLDRRNRYQKPIAAVALQSLATEYMASKRLSATGRIAMIKLLLRDGIVGFERQGNVSEASLIRELFFGESTTGTIKPPGELLKRAQRKVGDSDSRFRERRASIMRLFAEYLITFAATAAMEDSTESDTSDQQQLVTTGFVADSGHFVQMLADANSVTIVGMTNWHLTDMLEDALSRKRSGGHSDATWDSLEIVFLDEPLLRAVNDEREQVQDSEEALRQRKLQAAWAQSSVENFLKRNQPKRWAMYKYPYIPTLTGALLEIGDRKIAHLLIRSPQLSRADHLYIELQDEKNRLSSIFQSILHFSERLNMIVPVGFPDAKDIFQCTSAKMHVDVLKDRSKASGWLPMVLVITSRRRYTEAQPLMQLRTQENSVRELSRLSHLTGHVLQNDRKRPGDSSALSVRTSFGLADDTPRTAAQRIVQAAIGDDLVSTIQPVATGRYLHPDKEHLFFFIFRLDLPEGIQVRRQAEMHSFPLPQLLDIRASQVLRSAAELCRMTGVPQHAWLAAAEVISLNLSLHDYDDLGESLVRLAGRNPAELTRMASDIEQHITERADQDWVAGGRNIRTTGLAGWQYRSFFSTLMAQYREIGISGASELMAAVQRDDGKRTAASRLEVMYQDEDLMHSMPMEV